LREPLGIKLYGPVVTGHTVKYGRGRGAHTRVTKQYNLVLAREQWRAHRPCITDCMAYATCRLEGLRVEDYHSNWSHVGYIAPLLFG